jgi:tRNA dimethylallyltransferase
LKEVDEILEKGKIPILVGGSSFFFESIIYENFLPEVEPDFELRKELEKKTKDELFAEILEKDKKTAQRIDKNNKVRLIRAVEIIQKNGFVPEQKKKLRKKYDFEIYFLNPEKEILDEKIRKNFLERVGGMLKEAEILRLSACDAQVESKISAEQFQQLGLAYKNIFDF